MTTPNQAVLSAEVAVSASLIEAAVSDPRPEFVTLFQELDDSQRGQLAVDAWNIGLRALANAHHLAQESRLKDMGATLLDELDGQLQAHVQVQQQTIAAVLSKFFDPTEGQVAQRLTQFLADEGVLARLLDRYLAPQNSVLAETLARQVGATSDLFKKLSPTDSGGIVKTIEAQLRMVLSENQSSLAKALDPLAEGGAVARFLKSLREELKTSDQDRAKQLAAALAALDANDEQSLINRLVRETEQARQSVLQAMNPGVANSPMALMTTHLTTLLKEHAHAQFEVLQRQNERQERFETEVREALARMSAKKEASQVSPQGGLDFEDSVTRFLAEATKRAPCTVDATGNTPGARSRCKKGDVVVRFTDESAFAGSGVVFEAKRDASYTVQKAIDELDLARKNRDACAGVFVMARSHATEPFPRFARHGSNVLVIWDEEDRSTDAYLEAAIFLGLALATRAKRGADQGDLDALRDVEARIEAELKRLTTMEKHTASIRKNSDDLADELRKAHKALNRMLVDARETLKALNIELSDEPVERSSPIAFGTLRVHPELSARNSTVDEAAPHDEGS